MYTIVCVCVCVCVRVRVCVFVCLCVCACVCIYTHTHVYIYKNMYIRTHTYRHTHTHTYIHTYKHTFTGITVWEERPTAAMSSWANVAHKHCVRQLSKCHVTLSLTFFVRALRAFSYGSLLTPCKTTLKVSLYSFSHVFPCCFTHNTQTLDANVTQMRYTFIGHPLCRG